MTKEEREKAMMAYEIVRSLVEMPAERFAEVKKEMMAVKERNGRDISRVVMNIINAAETLREAQV